MEEKIYIALALARECYSMKFDLLTNATVVDDAIRFVSQKSQQGLESSHNNNEESDEPDYDEDKGQLEEEQEDQEETGEAALATTTNAVF
jgi:hypothetical protein